MRLGKAIALRLAEMDYHIALHYNTSKEAALQTKAEIEQLDGECFLFQADLSKPAGTERLIPDVLDHFQDLSLLVNNASIFNQIGLLETPLAIMDEIYAINLRAPIVLSQEYIKACSSGHIVNLLDSRVFDYTPNYFLYSLFKRSLRDFTLMAAKEFGPKFRVNAIAPGPILPPAGGSWEDIAYLKEKIPLKEWGDPRAITKALDFLMENSYITGQVLYIDGGQHLTY